MRDRNSHHPPRTRTTGPTARTRALLAATAAAALTACGGEPAAIAAPGDAPAAARAARLTVPGVPTHVVAVAGNGSATVRWKAPSDGGSPIIAYRMVIEPYGNVHVVEPADTIAVVRGLTNGARWKFQVFATNKLGSGKRSAFSNTVTPTDSATTPPPPPPPPVTAPGAPTAVTATAGDAQAIVRWTAPASTGGSAITGYRVTVSPGGRVVTVPAPATTTTVATLTNGTAYTFVVAATNAVGTGANSTASAPVTPVGTTTPPPPPPPPTGARWVSGYYVGYQRGLYPESEVDFSNLTHLLVGRIRPAATGGVIANFDVDDVAGPQMARTLSTRAHQAGRKALLMLGGEGEHDGFVGAASAANHARFVTNLLATMDALGYDGLDVDWEPIEQADRAPLLALLDALRAARPGILLTVPVGWVNMNFASEQADPWYVQLAARVDQMNVMSYSMAGPWGWEVWHHSPLTDHAGMRPSSVSGSVQAYRAAGVPAAKIGVGIGAYGSCWHSPVTPRQMPGPGVMMSFGDNAMSYTNIMSQYFAAANRVWDAAAQVPYLSFPSPRGPAGCAFVSYEDEQSVAAKGAFVRTQGLGGTIVWTIGQQHMRGAPAGSRDPLLKAAYRSIVE
ncbi:MAG: glycosyl hydrolase family 18 protein [Gemmatirosa sp.]